MRTEKEIKNRLKKIEDDFKSIDYITKDMGNIYLGKIWLLKWVLDIKENKK